jgi:hypothetical protein
MADVKCLDLCFFCHIDRVLLKVHCFVSCFYEVLLERSDLWIACMFGGNFGLDARR